MRILVVVRVGRVVLAPRGGEAGFISRIVVARRSMAGFLGRLAWVF